MDLRWEDRQRAFQARVLTEGVNDDIGIGVRPYRTFLGASTGAPPPAGSRIERALLVVIAGTAICSTLMLVGGPKTIVALIAGLTGGVALFAGLAGPDPRVRQVMNEPLLAIYEDRARPGAVPVCVTAITDDEQHRLGEEGFGNIVGSPRPGGTVGVFIDDYLVWARTPPRGNRKGDPAFGQL
ncbi:MAG: hypothetical protein AAGC53_14230 [Actinomycetota bacterium]